MRGGGHSRQPYGSFNLATHVGDEAGAVAANRVLLRERIPVAPRWLRQVHGVRCVEADRSIDDIEADASFSRRGEFACAVLTADCLPLLLCDEAGTVVAAVHAGWRGLAAGVVEKAVAAMQSPPSKLMSWLGPAIGPRAFEVGDEVRAAFLHADPGAEAAFAAQGAGKWLCDLHGLARRRLQRLGVERIYRDESCTFLEPERFFSYRRDGVTGRMVSAIWLQT